MEGRTVIMTTHQPAPTAVATRTIHLHPGGVLDEAPDSCYAPVLPQPTGAAR
jgi:ATP-binding cassette subfamily B protein/subfamily B ATP-binding cassette protein MsbA